MKHRRILCETALRCPATGHTIHPDWKIKKFDDGGEIHDMHLTLAIHLTLVADELSCPGRDKVNRLHVFNSLSSDYRV